MGSELSPGSRAASRAVIVMRSRGERPRMRRAVIAEFGTLSSGSRVRTSTVLTGATGSGLRRVCAVRRRGNVAPNPGTSFHIEEHVEGGDRDHGQGRHRFRRSCEEIRRREGDALHPLGQERRPRHHQLDLRAEPAHRRAEALGAPRRPRRVHEPRGLTHLQRLLRLRDPARQDAQPPAAAVRGNHHDPRRPRLHHGVERRRPAHHLRMEGRRAVRHSAQLLAPALQRLGPRSRALRLRHQRADRDQPLRGHRFHLRHQATTSRAASTASRIISRPRTRPRASCSRPTSCPTR